MWRSLFVVFCGLMFVGGAIASDSTGRRTQEVDVRGIALLRIKLDSVKVQHASALTAADSARLQEQIEARAYGIDRRQFHVPLRQEAIDAWWTPSGPGTWLSIAGILLVISGLFAARRSARARPRE